MPNLLFSHPEIQLLPPPGGKARRLALWILILMPFAFGALVLALGQDANWDFRNYHWYNAYAFLNGRYALDLLPSQTPFFYNPLLDVPYYWLATHVPVMAAAFVLGSVQGLNFVLLFMLAHAALRIPNPRHKVVICALLSLLGMLGGGGIALLGATFYDNVTSLGIFAAAILIIRYFDVLMQGAWPRAVMLALLFGLPAGLVMGLKLPCVVFCIGLNAGLLLAGGPWQRRVLVAFAFGCGVLLGALLSLGWWAYYLDTHYASPFFPYFNHIFHSPLLPVGSEMHDTKFIPSGWFDRLLFPLVFSFHPTRVGEIEWRDWRMPALYLLLPLGLTLRLCFGRGIAASEQIAVPYVARYLLWGAVAAYLVWLVMFAIYRYIVPLEMLCPLLIVCAIGLLPLRLQTRGMLAAVILVIVAGSIRPGNWTRAPHWLDHAVAIDRPALPDTDKLMLLMAGYEPYSYVLSEFPPAIPVVRIQSNFTSPDENKNFNQLIRARIAAHRAAGGRFALLIPVYQQDVAQRALAYYQLKFLPHSCRPVTDRLYKSQLALCDVVTLTKPVTHD